MIDHLTKADRVWSAGWRGAAAFMVPVLLSADPGFDVWEPDGYQTPQIQRADPPREVNFIEAIDALCDLLYVVFGTFVAWGLNPTPFFDEVHRSNLTKLSGDPSVRADGKMMKGSKFEPPNLAAVLEAETKTPREEWE